MSSAYPYQTLLSFAQFIKILIEVSMEDHSRIIWSRSTVCRCAPGPTRNEEIKAVDLATGSNKLTLSYNSQYVPYPSKQLECQTIKPTKSVCACVCLGVDICVVC